MKKLIALPLSFFLTGDPVAVLVFVFIAALIPSVIACVLVRLFMAKELRMWWVYLMVFVATLIISFYVIFWELLSS